MAVVLAAVPIALSIGVPTSPPPDAPSSAPPVAAPTAAVQPEPAEDPGPGVSKAGAPHDAVPDAIEAEQAELLIEKAAIEAEESRLRGKREELESFEREHPRGVPPELYATYEDARVTYNSDVKAFKSRAAAYTMRVAEMERRVEALRAGSP